MSLVNVISHYILAQNEAYKNLREGIMRAAAEANNDLRPNVDRFGDLHAPCHGYLWEDQYYGKGQYLPIPPEWRENDDQPCSFNPIYKHNYKVKSNLDEVEALQKLCTGHALVSAGKTWGDTDTCYAYIKTNKRGLDELLDDYKQHLKEQQIAENRKNKGTAPEGRETVAGTVKAIKEATSSFMVGARDAVAVTYKMLVELDDKSTVYGSVPKSLFKDIEAGSKVTFAATFERSNDDSTHAFYKRPSKAKII